MTESVVVGELEVIGRLRDASNATFLAADETGRRWVYKPVAGEKPLWDFPQHTLGRREVAAHIVSHRLGFDIVPLTIWGDGPLGEGSLQEWVEGRITNLVDLLRPEEVDQDWLPVVAGVDGDDRPVVLAHRDSEALRRMCLFDLVINNTDRKVGHLIDDGERLLGVDHGVSLHVQDKFRTVLWGFAGSPLSNAETGLLTAALESGLETPEGISGDEWQALWDRCEWLLELGAFPKPSGQWPAIPWPPW